MPDEHIKLRFIQLVVMVLVLLTAIGMAFGNIPRPNLEASTIKPTTSVSQKPVEIQELTADPDGHSHYIKNPKPKELDQTQSLQTFTLPDLDAIYISRTPRYYRYCLTYPNNIPTLCAGTENQKRWPDIGEIVTYEGHITNKGEQYTGLVHYDWLVDGVAVQSGESDITLQRNVDIVLNTYQTSWSSTRSTIEFRVRFVDSTVSEISTVNNSLSIGSHDLTISYWVETGQYAAFDQLQNGVGTYSFEDWMQWHIKTMNQRLRAAQFPIAPQGVQDQVRIDKFVVADELDGSTSPFRTDPDLYLIDGRWQSVDNDATNARGQNGFYQQYANQFAASIDWGLIHEVTHQIGVPDLYHMRLPQAPPNNGIQITDLNGQLVTKNQLPNNGETFLYPDRMGGGDRRPYPDDTYYSSHTAAGLNTNTGYRRGYFAEYYFDTPDQTVLEIRDSQNAIVANAEIRLHQRDPNTELFDNTPEIVATTDANGRAVLSNRTVTSVTTATKHTLKSNPFGQINVVGTNGTFIMTITKDNTQGYGFLLLHDLNIAYWEGQTQTAVIPVQTTFQSQAVSPTPTPDTIAPTLTITNPLNNTIVRRGSTVTITANATDNVGVTKVRFLVGDKLLCTDLTSPYKCAWNVPAKKRASYKITVRANDAAGNITTQKSQVTSSN